MHIRTGFDIALDTFGTTPLSLLLNIRPERQSDLLTPETITFDPCVPVHQYRDIFGNVCTRIVAPRGRISMSSSFVIADSGEPDPVFPDARQFEVEDLPDDQERPQPVGNVLAAPHRRAPNGSARGYR